jgi:hypothetical protein
MIVKSDPVNKECAVKITDVKTYLVKGYHDRLRWVFVHVYTDKGVESYLIPPDTPGLGAKLVMKEVKKHLVE